MACGARLMYATRFAPSPTGPLHLGHAFSALSGWQRARAAGGQFLVRIEDLDASRCRAEWEMAILADLSWLGLTWEHPVLRQSTRGPVYGAALDRLSAMGLTYACTCTRADIRAAASAPQEGPDGVVYPGTCRGKGHQVQDAAIRLDMAAAMARIPEISFNDNGLRRKNAAEMVSGVGDIVLARRDGAAAYHLAVVVDDAAQGITEVVRGEDLREATSIHVLLQHLLGLPTPIYHHHRLIRDESGKRLAKRDDARALAKYRAEGATPADIRRMVGL